MLAFRTPTAQANNESQSQSLSQSSEKRTTAHLLPCRISHTGPITSQSRHWQPQYNDNDKTHTSHFRGRQLKGRELQIPEGYEGCLLTTTTEFIPTIQPKHDQDEEDDEEEEIEVVHFVDKAHPFDRVIVWGHDTAPGSAEDAHAKAVGEWLSLANAIHAPSIET